VKLVLPSPRPARGLALTAPCLLALAQLARAQVPVWDTVSVPGQAIPLPASGAADATPPVKPERRAFSVLEGLELDGVVSRVGLPALDLAKVADEDRARAARSEKALRYGVGRDLLLEFSDGVELPMADGSVLWTAEVQLAGAVSGRLHIRDLHLPRGAEVVVYGLDAPGLLAGPYEGLGPHGDGQLWTPTRPGEVFRIECRIPNVKPGESLADFGFVVDRVIHGYRSPVGAPGGVSEGDLDPGAAGPCHNDVTCYPALLNNKNGVAGIGFINGDALFCSGVLLNNLASDFAPFWMTANHCLSTNATAQTSEIYWNYETSTCNGAPPAISGVPQSGVCTLLSTGAASDYSLLRIEGVVPRTNIWWSGWNTGGVPDGTTGFGIHHPSGDYKRISFGTFQNTSGCGGGSHFQVDWYDGPTEPGSSGSPFFADGYGYVGQLHCGPSACGNESNDDYGAWSATWPSVSGIFTAGAGDDALDENDSCAAAVFLAAGQYNDLTVKIQDEDWYRVTIPSGQAVHVDVGFTDAFGDIDLELYSACGGGLVAAAASSSNDEILVYGNQGITASYYLRVFLYDDVLNEYDLGIGFRPVNDDCSAALLIEDGVHSGTIFGATNDGSASCGASGSSPDVWYAYQAQYDGTLTVSTCGTHDGPGLDVGIDTVLSVHLSCGGADILCDDDDNPQIACAGLDQGVLRDSAVQLQVSGGQLLYFRVANYNNGATGPFTLRVDNLPDPPPNDACVAATVIGNGSHSGTLLGATNDGNASCGSSNSSPDVWYAYTATCDGILTVSTCGTHDGPGLDTGVDTVLSLYGSCGGVELACNDDDFSALACGGIDQGILRDSAVQLPVSIGQSLRIRVSNYNAGPTGPFALQVSCEPNNGSTFCDGSTGNCPCGAFGIPGHGCPNTNPNGRGARLEGTGNARFSSDSFGLQVDDGAFGKPGILLAGAAAINYPDGNPNVFNASGIYCVNPSLRGEVFFTDGSGSATISVLQGQPFGATAQPAGSTTFYQYWYRDPGNACQNAPGSAAAFNFSNAVEVSWIN